MPAFQSHPLWRSGLRLGEKLWFHLLTPPRDLSAEAGVHLYVSMVDVAVDAGIGKRVRRGNARDFACLLLRCHGSERSIQQKSEAAQCQLSHHGVLRLKFRTPAEIFSNFAADRVRIDHHDLRPISSSKVA